MIPEAQLAEYLDEIRLQVCSRCIERPPGGPPCAPLGKRCGVEEHLPALVEAIHQVKSGLIAPYLECTDRRVCEHCDMNHTSNCPCPMRDLAVLIVQAVETVDLRRQEAGPVV